MLYLVGTPIGNLEDITFRALKILKNSDIIACEDTRNTQKLLNYFEIKDKKLISYHEHNEDKISDYIINCLEENKIVSLVTDAGLPCISDPGYILVKKCLNENIKVTPIPGANAGLTALIASGIESYNYTFYGFLPRKNNELIEKLNFLLMQPTTAIIYESPYRIKNVIEKIVNLDKNRIISIARELTKLYEQIETNTAEKLLEKFNNNTIKEKGEFVLIISPQNILKVEYSNEKLIEEIEELINKGMKNSEAIKLVAKNYKINKRELYNLYHEKNI